MKNNKLIAEFMGVNAEIISTGNVHSWSDSPFFYTTEDSKEKVIENIAWYSKYHTSWDWLKPVIDKLREECGIVTLSSRMHVNLYSDIGEVYEAVVDFIKTYNDEQQLHY
jgi:hypothetical protein